MTEALAIELIIALLKDMPTIEKDVIEAWNALRGTRQQAPLAPLAPQVLKDTQVTADELQQPVK